MNELQRVSSTTHKHYNYTKRVLVVVVVNRCCFISKMISVALLLYPGLGLALSECKQWRSSHIAGGLPQTCISRTTDSGQDVTVDLFITSRLRIAATKGRCRTIPPGQFPRTISPPDNYPPDNSPPVLGRTFPPDNSPNMLCIHTYTCMHN